MNATLLRLRAGAAALLLVLLVACGGGPEARTPPPPEVAVVAVEARPLTLATELPGRLEPSRVAEVRARVAGIVLERVFEEGAEVAEGDVLFRIDPAPLEAARDSAAAALARAEADLRQAELRAKRYAPLAETRAVSQQEYDDAVSARDQAAAQVAVAKAALRTAELNLAYATVRAPISGRIGRALVTEGALVGQGEATPLATISQLDPLYVDLAQPSRELSAMRRAMASGALGRAEDLAVTVLTEDGHEHPHPGRWLFTDVTVDEGTGALTVRAEVPNPDGTLLPGTYVRAIVRQARVEDAILVPQQAVLRDAEGASVRVVGPGDVVEARRVEVGPAQGEQWVIRSGLAPGDRVIVEGVQKARPGAPVAPVPWEAEQARAGAR